MLGGIRNRGDAIGRPLVGLADINETNLGGHG